MLDAEAALVPWAFSRASGLVGLNSTEVSALAGLRGFRLLD